MIELQTGCISIPELSLNMKPLGDRNGFIRAFPAGRYHEIRDTATGCIWYGTKERIYPDSAPIPMWFCFNSRDQLESVELYPQFGEDETVEGFPMDAEDSEQKFCAAWLQRFCGLTWENSGFSWGTICNDYDARSDSCGIVIRYTKDSQDRKEES